MRLLREFLHATAILGAFATISASGADRIRLKPTDDWSPAEETRPDVLFQRGQEKFREGTFDPRAEGILKAAEAFTKLVFNFSDLRFQRAITYQQDISDNMSAEWSFSEPFGRGTVLLNDTPFTSEYLMRFNACACRSKERISTLLTALIAWGRNGAVPLGALVVGIPINYPKSAAFTGGPPPPQISEKSIIYDFSVDGWLSGEDLYLRVGIGKAFTRAHYPVPPLIPERFPPLTELIQSWSSQQIAGEVGRVVGPSAGQDLSEDRDFMLITELVRRGLSESELVSLLKSVPPEKSIAVRARLVLRALRANRKEAELSGLFEPALKMYEATGPSARQAVGDLFVAVQRQTGCSDRLESAALKLLKQGIFDDSALTYLDRCSASAETLQFLEGTKVPDWLVASKDMTIRNVRSRVATSPH